MNKNAIESSTNVVIFGVLGDLSCRKLLPALYQLDVAGLLPPKSNIVGVDRIPTNANAFKEQVKKCLNTYVKEALEPSVLERFINRLTFQHVNLSNKEDFTALSPLLVRNEKTNRVYYFSTPPRIYGDICEGLASADLIGKNDRVVLEKPIGGSLVSSKVINDQVSQYFLESQTYRIDHYLGKETVLNLSVLRFANSLFTNNWDRNSIDHVQITVAEEVGIEGRWGYYDSVGQMRDMVQNHLLQILTLIAMEPPTDLNADSIRDEKVKVLKALTPINIENIDEKTVRGQYSEGIFNHKIVPGYLAEEGANTKSNTESFVAIKAEINNWRWSGVPFYLRTGKRLNKKHSEIVIYFKAQPLNIFHSSYQDLPSNKLTIRLQPNEGVELGVMNKIPGISSNMDIHENKLDLSFSQTYDNERVVDAYERLMLEVIQGNQSLFVRRDEVEAAWQWADGILDAWSVSNKAPNPYPSGSWGPEASNTLISKDGRAWEN